MDYRTFRIGGAVKDRIEACGWTIYPGFLGAIILKEKL
jgi:hypothetical protein